MSLHPIYTTRHLRETYIRYLKTIKPFQDERLRQEFTRALEEENLLLKGPYIEITPPFATGKSLRELVGEGVLSPLFEQLCHKDGLQWERPLYKHQEAAIRKMVNDQRNVIVTTGTGSGKTESFLIPILNHLLREAEAGTLSQPGVRALILYPMNALANDQMERLRAVLAQYDGITFGRYIGETREQDKEALKEYEKIHHRQPLKNELISRQQMQKEPPRLLLTNYAMLEYLLLRPDDSPLFDGETGKHWHFIALDEAHVYDGAQATEIAMLLRRLQDRVTFGGQKRLQAILTSATLGEDTPESSEQTVKFARDLFALDFEWKENDPAQQDIIRGERLPESALGESWGKPSPQSYHLLASIAEDWRNSGSFQQPDAATLPGVPNNVLEQAIKATETNSEHAAPLFIFHILRGDENLRTLRAFLREEPALLQEAAQRVFEMLPPVEAQETLAEFVSAAILARETPEHATLLPARYHVFLRALEGAFVCLNTHAPEHQGDNAKPLFFLKRHKVCPHCGSRVFELANCTRCGAAYLIGNQTGGNELDTEGLAFEIEPWRDYLTQNSVLYPNEIEARNLKYFSLDDSLAKADEDALIEGGAEADEKPDGENLHAMELCIRCGALYERGVVGNRCSCGVPFLPVSEVEMGRRTTLRRCTSCSTYTRSGVIYRFLTGQDAPVSVLAGRLYEDVPSARKENERQFPGEGRKMLIFTDNRQQAAFFASYLERAQQRSLHRRLIVEMLKQATQLQEPLRLSGALSRLLPVANRYRIFDERDGLDKKRKQIAVWLMQEFSGLDKRLSLEGVGLMIFRPVSKENWRPPQELLETPWSFQEDEVFDLLSVLLNTLRRQGAVSYLLSEEGIDLLSSCRDDFLPRARPFYVRENDAESSYKYGIYSWLPASHNNSRLDFVMRLLKRRNPDLDDDSKARDMALDLLKRLWSHLTGVNSPVSDWWLKSETLPNNKGIAYLMAHDVWEIIPTLGEDVSGWYICIRCRNLSAINVGGVCPTYGCRGRLEPLENHRAWIEDNIYRYQYQHSPIMPLNAQEHTAQWKPEKAAEVQKDFVVGKLNVLSCSTTFELGVDVGDLNAIVLRNMPPSTANYIQRAGRAGRRTDSVALVVTFAQRRPHDLTFYDQPERMISGKIRPPIVSLKNDKIIRRHLHSVVFAEFFRWAKERVRYQYTGDFFAPPDPSLSGPELLRQFLLGRPLELESALFRIVPNEQLLRQTLKLENWGWVEELIDSEDAILDKTAQIIQEELREFERLEQEASQARDHIKAHQYQEIQTQIRKRHLIGYLGTHNVLPKYGFPTDVVRLQTDHLNIPEARDIELDRDLKVAISEFAPGGQVVAAKQIWYSRAIRKMPNRLWTPYAYAICNECKRMTVVPGDDRTPMHCGSCQQPINASRQKGVFIVPEHGFLVDSKTDKPGEQPPEHIYASRVYFSHYSLNPNDLSRKISLDLAPDPAFSFGVQVLKGYSRYAWLALVNNGYGQGFNVCTTCGYADVIEPTRVKRKGHDNPLTHQPCPGSLKPYHLGHRFMTDVLELRLSISMPREEQVYSFLYAILNGASDALDIPREDVGGLVYYTDGYPSFILFDDTPGGSGYVQHIHEHLLDVFESAYRRVSECSGCSPETSCYSCLRSYDNQPFHDKLERRLAWDILGHVLNKPLSQG
ncbi:MAG: DEAD/DEAH box helicase [Anaerolineales bacterium]|nr:MAG: DEAD/DEAH box helicase [Anaerolineales bacterium]GER78903.1 DEAD/DEAH box helicase [Candidatus Denitrolinea symbiosum]